MKCLCIVYINVVMVNRLKKEKQNLLRVELGGKARLAVRGSLYRGLYYSIIRLEEDLLYLGGQAKRGSYVGE